MSLVDLLSILKQAVMITGFVFVMMLVIEYINVQTNGIWQKKLSGNRWKQYIFAALLGAIPGCLGAFTVVALFSHRLVSFGAIVAAMIATSGDEAFVMLAMFPKTAVLLTMIILIVGIIAGFLTDKFYVPKKLMETFSDNKLPFHPEEQCKCFEKDKFYTYLKKPSIYRIILIIIIILLLMAVATGFIAGDAEIYTMDIDGSNKALMTTTGLYAWAPKYSPDDSKIVFQSFNDTQLYIYDIALDSLTQYTNERFTTR